MKRPALACLLVNFIVFIHGSANLAFETDQYNLPPVPLADIGDEVSEYIEENLIAAVRKINTQIALHESCVGNPKKGRDCGSADRERAKLAYLRSNAAVAREVYKQLGGGNLFVSKTGKWIGKHKFLQMPDRYKTGYRKSIFVFMPIDYMTISPTVKLFGTEFGTDKIEHFVQQGYKYYAIAMEAETSGEDKEHAEQKAVHWGQMTEWTYFGMLVSGVFSNADLYANYAGMKFYQGLTQTMKIGDLTRPPLFVLRNGSWEINDTINLRNELIRPFINDRLNEALNPSIYAFNLYPTVRRVVKKQSCPEWRKLFPGMTRQKMEQASTALTLWNGEDYGFKQKEQMVPISTCFEG